MRISYLAPLIFATSMRATMAYQTAPRAVAARMKFAAMSSVELKQPIKPSTPGKLSFSASSTNLVKNCVGAGVFSLSSRLAAISIDPKTQLLASLLIFTMAGWATYNFYSIGKSCEMMGTNSYADVWSKTISKESSWIVQMVVLVSPIVSCLASGIVLTDVLGTTLRNAGIPASIYTNRNLVISILFGTILYPLCKLKDFTALRNVSKLGLLGQLIATIAIIVRYLDKSYSAGGIYFLQQAATRTAAAASMTPVWKSWFVLASLLSYCFVAHYNAPKYYSELDGASSIKFRNMATVSYMTSALIYVMTMILGTATFGMDAKPFLLNNLSPTDPLAAVARLAFGASVLASFPLIFMVMRNWFINLAEKKIPLLGGRKRVTTVLLAGIAFLTSKFRDISFVGSLSGATLGCGMAFIFPSIIYMRAIVLTARKNNSKVPINQIVVNGILLLGGVALSCLGTYNSLFGFKK